MTNVFKFSREVVLLTIDLALQRVLCPYQSEKR